MPEVIYEDVFLGLGSNLNDPQRQLSLALEMMPRYGMEIIKASATYETVPWGVTGQPNFFNLVVQIATGHGPHALMERCLILEQKQGRMRRERWGPRVLDIDILAVGALVMQQNDLVIPHPRLHERAFVLRPWADLAPGFRVPGLSGTVAELWEALPASEKQKVWRAEPETKEA